MFFLSKKISSCVLSVATLCESGKAERFCLKKSYYVKDLGINKRILF